MPKTADTWIKIEAECPDCGEIFPVEPLDVTPVWIITECPYCECAIQTEKPEM